MDDKGEKEFMIDVSNLSSSQFSTHQAQLDLSSRDPCKFVMDDKGEEEFMIDVSNLSSSQFSTHQAQLDLDPPTFVCTAPHRTSDSSDEKRTYYDESRKKLDCSAEVKEKLCYSKDDGDFVPPEPSPPENATQGLRDLAFFLDGGKARDVIIRVCDEVCQYAQYYSVPAPNFVRGEFDVKDFLQKASLILRRKHYVPLHEWLNGNIPGFAGLSENTDSLDVKITEESVEEVSRCCAGKKTYTLRERDEHAKKRVDAVRSSLSFTGEIGTSIKQGKAQAGGHYSRSTMREDERTDSSSMELQSHIEMDPGTKVVCRTKTTITRRYTVPSRFSEQVQKHHKQFEPALKWQECSVHTMRDMLKQAKSIPITLIRWALAMYMSLGKQGGSNSEEENIEAFVNFFKKVASYPESCNIAGIDVAFSFDPDKI